MPFSRERGGGHRTNLPLDRMWTSTFFNLREVTSWKSENKAGRN